MNDKEQAITALREEFNRWEELIASLSEERINAPLLSSGQSIKDVIAHLRAWQQVSSARLEAALHGGEPELPEWLAGSDPDSEDELDGYNNRIYQTYREKPWSGVHQAWREGFLQFLELAEAIPEEDLLEVGKYPWLKEYPLIAVLQGSYEHHHIEHLEPLLNLLRFQGIKNAGIQKSP